MSTYSAYKTIIVILISIAASCLVPLRAETSLAASSLLTNGDFSAGITGWTPNCKDFSGTGYTFGTACGSFYQTSPSGLQMNGGATHPYEGVYQIVPASANSILTGTVNVTAGNECADGSVNVSTVLLDVSKQVLGPTLNSDPMFGNIVFGHHPYSNAYPSCIYPDVSSTTAYYAPQDTWTVGSGIHSFSMDIGAIISQQLPGIDPTKVVYVQIQLTDYADGNNPFVTFGSLNLTDNGSSTTTTTTTSSTASSTSSSSSTTTSTASNTTSSSSSTTTSSSSTARIAATPGVPYTWGGNGSGQLGNGTTANTSTPAPINRLTGVTAVSGGADHALALLSDGTVAAWGGNAYGQLGNNSTANSSTPLQVTGLASVTAISAGVSFSLALKSDGTVWAWGRNQDGQLGKGTTTDSTTPVQVSGLINVVAIAAGGYFGVALKSDGTVWVWGYGANGELGNGAYTSSNVPVQSQLTNASSIAASQYHVLADKSDGTVWAWGYNSVGQLGNGTTGTSAIPVQVTGLTGAISVAAGGYDGHSIALKSDGTVWAWGRNGYGELGNGTITNSLTPVQVSGLTGVMAIASGDYHSLALKGDGTVWGWGANNGGELGTGSTTGPGQCGTVACSTTPIQTSGLTSGLSVAAGNGFSLAVKPPAPTLLATSAPGPSQPTTNVTLTGTGFTPGGNVALEVHWPNGTLSGADYTSLADASGNFTFGLGQFCSSTGAGVAYATATDDASKVTATANNITVYCNPAPSLSSISPTSVKAGTTTDPNLVTVNGSTFLKLTVTGSSFINSSSVQWNGTSLNTTSVSSTQLTALVPAADIATVTTANVTVYTPPYSSGGTDGGTTNSLSLSVTPSPTLQASSSPGATQPTTVFTLSGSGYTPNGSVTLEIFFPNGSDIQGTYPGLADATGHFTFTTGQFCSATGAGSAYATASDTTSSISAAQVTGITVYCNPVPTITALGQNSAQAGTSVSLGITGTGFQTTSQVNWSSSAGATTLTPSWVSADGSQLTVTLPATLQAATATVTVFTPPYSPTGTDGGTSNGVLFYLTQTGATVSNTITGTSSTGSATASAPGTGLTASTSGTGSASVTVAQYSSNPTSVPPPAATSAYFDVYVPGSGTTGVTITDCNVSGNTLYWWDGTQWSPVSNQTYNSPTAGCITATLNGTSSPTDLQLTGTPFAVVAVPPPGVVTVVAPTSPLAVNTAVSASATFTDLADAVPGPYTATFDWGDSSTPTSVIGTAPTSSAAGSASSAHTYTQDGVYTVSVTVTDAYGQVSVARQFQYVVVYDPSAGFVTGGGWINSPVGALSANPNQTGRADFGFVSKYQKGATVPSGQTQFQFKDGNLDFHSSSYNWLVISGTCKAQYKGSGTVNGSGSYGFMLTAIDGERCGNPQPDTFRIKIWDTTTGNTIYDNQLGAADTADPTTSIAGGDIQIHT